MEAISIIIIIFGIILLIINKKMHLKAKKKYLFYWGLSLIILGFLFGARSFIEGIKEGVNSYQEAPRRPGNH